MEIGQRIVYSGMRVDGSKLVQAFYYCDEAGLPLGRRRDDLLERDGSTKFWPKPVKYLQGVPVGSIVEVVEDDAKVTFASKPFPVCKDTELVHTWALRDRASKAVIERERLQAAIKKNADANVFAALAPIRAEYARALPTRKVAILAEVIAYITRSGG